MRKRKTTYRTRQIDDYQSKTDLIALYVRRRNRAPENPEPDRPTLCDNVFHGFKSPDFWKEGDV